MTVNTSALGEKDLRKFGLITGAIVVVIFAFFFPWLLELAAMPVWPWIVAGLLWLPALLAPLVLGPVYRLWMKIGHGIGWINTRLILALIFYLLVLPLGLGMRLFGNDPMRRKFDSSCASYRIASSKQPRDQLEKPY